MLCRSACSCTPSNSTEWTAAIVAASMPNNVIIIIGPPTDIQMGKQLNHIPMIKNNIFAFHDHAPQYVEEALRCNYGPYSVMPYQIPQCIMPQSLRPYCMQYWCPIAHLHAVGKWILDRMYYFSWLLVAIKQFSPMHVQRANVHGVLPFVNSLPTNDCLEVPYGGIICIWAFLLVGNKLI